MDGFQFCQHGSVVLQDFVPAECPFCAGKAPEVMEVKELSEQVFFLRRTCIEILNMYVELAQGTEKTIERLNEEIKNLKGSMPL